MRDYPLAQQSTLRLCTHVGVKRFMPSGRTHAGSPVAMTGLGEGANFPANAVMNVHRPTTQAYAGSDPNTDRLKVNCLLWKDFSLRFRLPRRLYMFRD